MSGAHIPVALSDSAGGSEVTILAVHVVSSGPRIVTQPDSEVLHRRRAFFVDLLAVDNFTVSLLNLNRVSEIKIYEHS